MTDYERGFAAGVEAVAHIFDLKAVRFEAVQYDKQASNCRGYAEEIRALRPPPVPSPDSINPPTSTNCNQRISVAVPPPDGFPPDLRAPGLAGIRGDEVADRLVDPLFAPSPKEDAPEAVARRIATANPRVADMLRRSPASDAPCTGGGGRPAVGDRPQRCSHANWQECGPECRPATGEDR